MLDRQDKTNRVFDAALKVFAHFGYRQATMELIANELDMVKGSLYSYCSGKKDHLQQGRGLLRWRSGRRRCCRPPKRRKTSSKSW